MIYSKVYGVTPCKYKVMAGGCNRLSNKSRERSDILFFTQSLPEAPHFAVINQAGDYKAPLLEGTADMKGKTGGFKFNLYNVIIEVLIPWLGL